MAGPGLEDALRAFRDARATIRGSYGARTQSDMPAIISMVTDGRVHLNGLVSQRVPLEAAAETYRELDRGEIVGRAVVDMSLR